MIGDATLGAVLRELREARGLTMTVVARQARCAVSLLSRVESGSRTLPPWLAQELDRIYATGSVVASLARASGGTSEENPASGMPTRDVFVVVLPQGGVAMLLSRRETMTALGCGMVAGGLQGEFERALDRIQPNSDVLQYFQNAFDGFKETTRIVPPRRLIDGMTGNVADSEIGAAGTGGAGATNFQPCTGAPPGAQMTILDGLRRRAADGDRNRYSTLQAHYAEPLSWLSEEAGDLPSALWWIDRASHWAQAAGWTSMTAFTFMRRSMIVMSFSGDGLRAVDQARPVLEMPQASPRMKGMAAKQVAAGYALAGNRDESRRALDAAMDWLAQPVREDDAVLSQLHVVNDDLLAVYQTTCDVYLGYGARVVPMLEPRLESLAGSSFRRATITRAKLARAYANAGQGMDSTLPVVL